MHIRCTENIKQGTVYKIIVKDTTNVVVFTLEEKIRLQYRCDHDLNGYQVEEEVDLFCTASEGRNRTGTTRITG